MSTTQEKLRTPGIVWILMVFLSAILVGAADAFLTVSISSSKVPATAFFPRVPSSSSSSRITSHYRYHDTTTARLWDALEPPTDHGSIRAVAPIAEDDDDTVVDHLYQGGCALDNIQRLTRDALLYTTTTATINNGGAEKGLQALEELAGLCARRLPYDFENKNNKQNQDNDDNSSSSSSLIARTPSLLPGAVTDAILDRVRVLAHHGLLSTNPDSVDGLPSLHLNLVSNGQAVLVAGNKDDDDNNDQDEISQQRLQLFQQCLTDLLDLVRPHIYDRLLPAVRQQLNDDSIQVGDVFLRQYGTDTGVDDDQPGRRGLSAHFDVSARATSVIALDATAATGRNGLYTISTTAAGNDDDNGSSGSGNGSSNHAALRRFFPLDRGDAVTHTWDVLHGVAVEPSLERTSLIVWFVETTVTKTGDDDGNANACTNDSDDDDAGENRQPMSGASAPPRWLTEHRDLESSDVAQFVLGSAMENNCNDADEEQDAASVVVDLYLRSAAQGNTFALTRLGSLVGSAAAAAPENETQQSVRLDEAALTRARELARHFRNNNNDDKYTALHQQVLGSNDRSDDDDDDDSDDSLFLSPMDLAKTFWLEGALRGNPLAQMALADELMYKATTENNKNSSNNTHDA